MLAAAAPASAASGGSALGPVVAGVAPTPAPVPATHSRAGNPFGTRGMWIWYVSASGGGDLQSIVAAAHQYGIGTLMIKAGDGTGQWSQFNSQLTSTLHANGLRACAWQYVYGAQPVAEAQVGAAAVRAGADCLLIDAEIEYERQANNYMRAQTYLGTLRRLVGANYPIALAGFPYMDYHPAFPYSVFLGPGGAQYNVPQMYWFDIGTTVDDVFAHTYQYNRLYGRPIFPLGQVYNNPPLGDVRHFRQVSRVYGAPGVSWWDWQEASPGTWQAISQPVGSPANVTADQSVPTIRRGAQSDLVVWAQEHLITAGYGIAVDGWFGFRMLAAVKAFQQAHGLVVDGVIGAATWGALLRYPPARIRWTASGAHVASLRGFSLTMPVPASSRLPARRDEIAGHGGRG
jgi:hypothetical protein